MVFWDYDVDGVTSSYIMYEFITRFLKYKKVSIQYPDRIKEGYGIKKIHIDDMKKKWVNLIITVDNGIASLQEAIYAKQQWIDLIITDHHQDLESIPEAVAVVNPQVSPNYPFKGLAGVGVTFKLICALLSKSSFDQKERKFLQIFCDKTSNFISRPIPPIGINMKYALNPLSISVKLAKKIRR